MKRYHKLLDLIDIFMPCTIAEIGAWNGHNAVRMIQQAQKYHSKVFYAGFDLFEDADEHTDEEEFNVKPHNTLESVNKTIRSACPDAIVTLTKGNTRETLKNNIYVDFCFIDGGHSISTIESDYNACKGSGVIVFDDYYLPDENGKCPDITEMGCNMLLRHIPHSIINTGDRVKGGGIAALAVCFG